MYTALLGFLACIDAAVFFPGMIGMVPGNPEETPTVSEIPVPFKTEIPVPPKTKTPKHSPVYESAYPKEETRTALLTEDIYIPVTTTKTITSIMKTVYSGHRKRIQPVNMVKIDRKSVLAAKKTQKETETVFDHSRTSLKYGPGNLFVGLRKVTYYEAKDTCEKNKGKLATITEENVSHANNLARSYVRENENDFWIQAPKETLTGNAFKAGNNKDRMHIIYEKTEDSKLFFFCEIV
ncbi:MAG: uncharacterized protein A8A55_1712 [Amphiamblys sp. WSBS2006]|nr:MAG: uncharacterized protein A8A55_1712 [Amphiamblys sp. WSBS2006]